MKSHIIPQTLLRGFRVDNSSRKDKAKIMMLEPDDLTKDFVCNLYQDEDYYPDDVEEAFAKKFEQPFGVIKKKFIDVIKESRNSILLSRQEYLNLICFFVAMWRRNDVQIKKMTNLAKLTMEYMNSNADLDKMLLPQFKGKSTEELITEGMVLAKDKFFNEVIKKTNKNDETVRKSINSYRPFLIYNDTNINFPLHNKYASILMIDSKDDKYPDLTIEPISNKMYLALMFDKARNYKKKDEEIRIVRITDPNFIKSIIKAYLLDTAKSVVVDNSNIQFVEKRLRDPLNFMLNRGSREFKDFVSFFKNLLVPIKKEG